MEFLLIAFPLSKSPTHSRPWLVPLLAAWYLTGCGVQGPPRPPRIQRPERVTDLKATQVGTTIEVRFTPPRLAMDGQRLSRPLEIEILRSVQPPGAKAPAVAPTAMWLTLASDKWPQDLRNGTVVYPARLSDQDFRQELGSTIVLAVRTLTRGFRQRRQESELSNVLQIPLLDVSGPMQDVVANTTENAIELRWTAPTQGLSGQPLRGLPAYRVYRSQTGKPGSFELLGETSSLPYLDRHFEFGRSYSYKVRAVFSSEGKIAESEDSQTVTITPRDIFPPAAPVGLTALFTAGAVELIWSANSEADLAGYNIHRSENHQAAQRLNAQLLRTPLYRDAAVTPGNTYYYYVTAVDLSNNESKASAEVAAETK